MKRQLSTSKLVLVESAPPKPTSRDVILDSIADGVFTVDHIDTKALSVLMRHHFSGNVRELINAVEPAFVLCPGGVLLAEHLPGYLLVQDPTQSTRPGQTVKEFESDMIRRVLSRHGFNRSKTANELGMHKTTLWRKMKRLNISFERSH